MKENKYAMPKIPIPDDVLAQMIEASEEACAQTAARQQAVLIILQASTAAEELIKEYQSIIDFNTKMKRRFRELAIEHAAKKKA